MKTSANTFLNPLLICLYFFFLLLFTFYLYSKGLFGDFIFDDIINIVQNTRSHIDDLTLTEFSDSLTSGISSGLPLAFGRGLSMLSFGLNYYFTGLDPSYFKLTNILIHLFTGIGIFFLSKELLKISHSFPDEQSGIVKLLPLAVSACWLLHPLNVSAVLYIVQRMTLLSAFFTVFTLIYYCRIRHKSLTRYSAVLAFSGLCLFIFTGFLCKENAILTIPFILLIEYFFMHFNSSLSGQRLFLRLILIFLVLIPGMAVGILLITNPEAITGTYEFRPYSLWQRTLTEFRVLWLYLGWIVAPDTTQFAFFHDDYRVSENILNPISTLFAVCALSMLAWALIRFRKHFPLLCFGLAFFFTGHALESTVIDLELVFEHRNYLPDFGILFGLLSSAVYLPKVYQSKKLGGTFLLVYLALLSHGTYSETSKWANVPNHLLTILRHNPGSYRTTYSLGHMYLSLGRATGQAEYLTAAREYYMRAVSLSDSEFNAHAGILQIDSLLGQETPEFLLQDLLRRIRDYPNSSATFIVISEITDCWYSGLCSFNKQFLVDIYSALATNQVTAAVVKQGMLLQIARGIMLDFHNTLDGLALLYLSQSLNNTLTTIDIMIIETELALGNRDEARNHLTVALGKTVESKTLAVSLLELEARFQGPTEGP